MPHTPLSKAPIDVAPTRGAERIRAVIEVEVTPENGTPVHAWATDISESGLYLQTTAQFSEADRLSLRFTLDGAVVAIANARVTRVRPFEPINVTGEMPGAAVVFDEISPLERARVKRFVRQQLPGGELDDTLPPTLLAQQPRQPREETLPLHFAAAEAEANAAEIDEDPTPVSPSRFDEIVTSLPPLDSLAPRSPLRADNPSVLSTLRPLSLPPVVVAADDDDDFEWPSPASFDPVSVVPKSAVPRSVDDVFASIDRELRLDAFLADNPDLHSAVPSEVAVEASAENGPNANEPDANGPDAYEDHIDFSRISEWKFVIAGRATPLPPQSSLPPEPAPATWADACGDELHVPSGLPDLRLRTETLPGGPADERLHAASLRPSMSLLREDSSPLDRTRPEIPSQKPMLVTSETRPEIPSRKPSLVNDYTRPEIPSQKPGFVDRGVGPAARDGDRDLPMRASPAAGERDAQTTAATTGDAPQDEEGMTMSGLWFAEGDEIADRLANGRSLPPGVKFDDGDSLLLHADEDEEDAAAEEFVASLGAHLLARDSTVGLSDASLNRLDDSLLRNVHLSDSEVAFANHLEDAPLPSPSILTLEPTPAPDADARIAQIFEDSSDCIATSDVGQEALEFNRDITTDVQRTSLGQLRDDDDDSYGDLSLRGDSDEDFALPSDLDRSIREDQGGVFGRMGHHEMTHRISRRRKTPWRAIALGAAVVAATGIGVGLALIEGPSAAAGVAQAATAPGTSPQPKSVAEVESGLIPSPTPVAVPALPSAPSLPSAPAVTTPPAPKAPELAPVAPTSTRIPATKSAATTVKPAAVPTEAMVVERGRITVPLAGGTVKKKFALSNPPRVVVDLVGATFPGNVKEAVGKHGIAGVRFGRPDGKTVRFVVELEGGGTPSNLSVLKRANSLAVAWR